MSTSKETKIKVLRKKIKNYKRILTWFCFATIVVSLSFMVIFIRVTNLQTEPILHEFSNILMGLIVALTVAFVLQVFRDAEFLNTINETIASKISENVSEVVKEIRNVKNVILPDAIYSGEEEKLREEQIRCFSKTTRIRFMSISALNLLNKSIPRIKRRDDLNIELLLLNPKNLDMIDIRSRQLHEYEGKTSENLQKEIIDSIKRAHEICLNTEGVKKYIKIRLHDTIPFCRVELADGTLYLSYFKSQISKKNMGSVATYQDDSDIHNAFAAYFSDTWHNIGIEKEIAVNEYDSQKSLMERLGEIMGEDFLNDITREVADIDHEDEANTA